MSDDEMNIDEGMFFLPSRTYKFKGWIYSSRWWRRPTTGQGFPKFWFVMFNWDRYRHNASFIGQEARMAPL
jgi:hypothetical protein